MKKRKIISIVIPCYNEQVNTPLIYKEIKKAINGLKYRFEIIFVDNGSTDKTRQVIRKLAQKDKIVKGLGLSRNFGPEASWWAGIQATIGDAVIALECDLQSPPQLIPQFIDKWEQGFNSVIGVYDKIDDYLPMIFLRKIYYQILHRLSQINIPANATGFGLIDRKVVTALQAMPEKYRFYRGLRAWVGFKSIQIMYHRNQRKNGHSSYNIINYFQHAERGLFGFSYLLLDLIFYGSLLYLLLTLGLTVVLTIYFLLSGWFNSAFFFTLIVIDLLGVQFLSIGIIGKYIQVIAEESKARPIYLVEEYID